MNYRQFLRKGMDLAPMGVMARQDSEGYFCTPVGAEIFGWAGVDGIHFCFVEGCGETVFAVSPMNGYPEYVHPLAGSFEDFLRLLLACGDSAALEQAWQWDRGQFEDFLAQNPCTQAQKAAQEGLRGLGLTPMEDPWGYMQRVRKTVRTETLAYSEEFYELNPDAAAPERTWEVYFDGNFWGHHGRGKPGQEAALGQTFRWLGHQWVLPAVYLCGRGLVADFCMSVSPEEMEMYMKKWDLTPENEGSRVFTKGERMLVEGENPLRADFRCVARVNGKEMTSDHGCGVSYLSCLPDGYRLEEEALQVLDHYGLDRNLCWWVQRCCFPWASGRKPKVKTLEFELFGEGLDLPGTPFRVTEPGEQVVLKHPKSDKEYTLTVLEYQRERLDQKHFLGPDRDYPDQLWTLGYRVEPELPPEAFFLTDAGEPDRPRRLERPRTPEDGPGAALGVIGGVDGPVAVLVTSRRGGEGRSACSELRFDPEVRPEWLPVFREEPEGSVTVAVEWL